jgi:hypothetical protein
MKCPRCSFENAASSVFCYRCGQVMSSANGTPLFSTENFGTAGVVSGQIVGDVHIHPSNSKGNYNGTLTFENAAPITVAGKHLKFTSMSLVALGFLASVVVGSVAFLANITQIISAIRSSLPNIGIASAFAILLSLLLVVLVPCVALIPKVLRDIAASGGAIFFRKVILKDREGRLYVGNLAGKCSDCGSPLIFRSEPSGSQLYAHCSAYPRAHGPWRVEVSSFFA